MKQGAKRSRWWFDLHAWLGLKLSIAMTLVLVTGTLAVFSSELDWLTHASMRVNPQPGDPLVFQGYSDATWLVRPRASYVAFDPATQALLGQHRSADATLHQRISEMADPLHFGYFGGLWTKFIWFGFGATMSALSITGIIIYGKRLLGSGGLRKRQVAMAKEPRVGQAAWWQLAWQGMGLYRWIGILGMVSVLVLTPLL